MPLIIGAVAAFVIPIGLGLVKGLVAVALLWTFSTQIASYSIYFSGLILGFAGILFDTFVRWTVIEFNQFFYATLQSGITRVWEVFRDISNIVIIGSFVFIAISMILGVQSFGTRKIVAKALIIAILINFSLLFTRLIISASNFVAGQFYTTAINQQPPSNSSVFSLAEQYSKGGLGISGQFILRLRLESAMNSNATLDAIQDRGGLSTGWILALFYGVAVSMMILAFAGALGYATWLLGVRAVLFLFLLMTSALAFASYLLPQGAAGSGTMANLGWKTWWSALLRNSVLAPMLFLLIWATLLIADALYRSGNSPSGGGAPSFDQLFTNPESGSGLLALFSFFVVTGMLFASCKIAGSFSKSIAGFDLTSWGLRLSAGIPLALGDRFAGFMGRRFLGPAGVGSMGRLDARREDLQRRLNSATTDADKRKYQSALARNERLRTRAERMADSTFQFGKTKAGETFFKKMMGVPDAVTGGAAKSYLAGLNEKSTALAKQATDATKLGKTAEEAIREGAARAAQSGHEAEAKKLEGEHKASESRELSHKPIQEAVERTARTELERLKQEEEALISQRDARSANDPRRTGDNTRIAKLRSDMNTEDERIKQARGAIQSLEQTAKEARKKYEDHMAAFDDTLKAAGNQAVEKAKEDLGESAKEIGTILAKTSAFPINVFNKQLADAVRSEIGETQSDSTKQKKLLRTIFDEIAEKKEK